jgi:hypothetical protein
LTPVIVRLRAYSTAPVCAAAEAGTAQHPYPSTATMPAITALLGNHSPASSTAPPPRPKSLPAKEQGFG